ncbi:MAG: NUDIX domain-containing protein [Bacteroidetes bacterium]|nr:NUDIX domain-containing protein [Bacteroidota bacterium]
MQNKSLSIKVATDAIVFGYSPQEGISVVLISRKYPPFQHAWALPGGFVLNEESLEEAVQRELEEEAGIRVNYLEQLFTFGHPDRDPRQRVISVAYMGLVNTSRYQELKASTDAAHARWFPIKKLPVLAFDHKQILAMAIDRLRAKIHYQPIGFELLDKEFPFSDLEKLYSVLLDKTINRRNFSKKILSFGILEETGNMSERTGKGRPGKLYRFNTKRYRQLLKEGFHFEI